MITHLAHKVVAMTAEKAVKNDAYHRKTATVCKTCSTTVQQISCSQTSGCSQFILLSHAVKQHYDLTVQVTFDPVDIMLSIHHVAAVLPELKCSLSGPQARCSLPYVTVQCCLRLITWL